MKKRSQQLFPPPTREEEASYRVGTLWRLSLLILIIVFSIFWNVVYAQAVFTQCATEGGTCTFTGNKLIRYGEPWNNRWSSTRTMTSPVLCNNTTFAPDPSPGTGKRCEIMDAPVVTPPVVTPPVVTPPVLPPSTGILPPLTSSEVYVVTWTPPTTNTDGSALGPILKTETQASLSPTFTTYYQWESPGLAPPSLYVENGPTGTVYWRVRLTTAIGTSDFSAVAVTERQWIVQQKPPCWPKPFGTGSWVKADQNADGFAVYWQCVVNNVADHYGFIGTWASLEPDWMKQLSAAFEAGSLSALWDAKITGPSSASKYATVRPMWNALRAANPLPVITGPTHVVRPNGTTPSRPAYAIVNGARTSRLAGRVNVLASPGVGTACDCTAFSAGSGATLYCSVEGRENVATAATDTLGPSAALCVARPAQ